MSRFRLLSASAAVLATLAVPAAADAVGVTITRVETHTERAHPAVPTERVVVRVCVRNTSAVHRDVAPSVRSSFLLTPRRADTNGGRAKGYTIAFPMPAGSNGERCQRRNVAGVAEDVLRRLRFTTERSDGVRWKGAHEVGPGHRAS